MTMRSSLVVLLVRIICVHMRNDLHEGLHEERIHGLNCTDDMMFSCNGRQSYNGLKGNSLCRCRSGYFLSGGRCKKCSFSCHTGEFMLTACTSSVQMVCKPCQVCSSTMYEIAPCSTNQDRMCLDVAFPLTENSDASTDTHGHIGSQVLKKASNVFVERLRNEKSLEAVMYLAPNQSKSMEVNLVRESGLLIYVHILGDSLVPVYEDVEQPGDNDFIRKSHRFTESEKNGFNQATKYFCRNPIPDDYHFGLTIIPNRTTLASVTQCHSADHQCPSLIKNGDVFYRRAINTKCPHTKAEDHLSQYDNSIICLNGGELSKKIFNFHTSPPTIQSYYSTDCQKAKRDCLQCLKQFHGSCGSSYDQCCGIACYKESHCLYFYSKFCPPLPGQCATGAVFEFTLEPNAHSLSSKFQCHLRRVQRDILYEIQYSVVIPNLKYTFPKFHGSITNRNIDTGMILSDRVQFIKTIFSPEISSPREIIATGNYGNKNNVKIRIFGIKNKFNHRDYRIMNTSLWSYTTGVQFNRPLLYSSSSWRDGGCDKNISRILPAQSIFENSSFGAIAHIQKHHGIFNYQMFPLYKSAHIRIKIPDEESVLSWYRNVSSHYRVLVRKSLKLQLLYNHHVGLWTVNVTGHLLACPGYIRMTVRDQCSGLVDEYDVFITCPLRFHFTITVPSERKSALMIIAVAFQDNGRKYQYFLTSLSQPYFARINEVESTPSERVLSSWRQFVVISLIAVMLGIFILVIICQPNLMKSMYVRKTVERATSKNYRNLNGIEPASHYENLPSLKQHIRKPFSPILLAIFIFLYVLYMLLFTLTATFSVIYIMLYVDADPLSRIALIKMGIETNFTNEIRRMSDYTDAEMKRMFKLAAQRASACNSHLENHIVLAIEKIDNDSQLYMNRSTHTVQESLKEFITFNAEKYNGEITRYMQTFRSDLRKNIKHFRLLFSKFVAPIESNEWLEFPRELNSSQLRHNFGMKTAEMASVFHNIRKKMRVLVPTLPADFFTQSMDPRFHTVNKSTYREIYLKFIADGGLVDYMNDDTKNTSDSEGFSNETNIAGSLLNSVESEILYKIYTIVATSFITLDIILIYSRMVWLISAIKQLQLGVELRIPLDSFTLRLMQFAPADLWTISYIPSSIKPGNIPYSLVGPEMHPLIQNRSTTTELVQQSLPQNLENLYQRNVTTDVSRSYNDRKNIKELLCDSVTWQLALCLVCLWILCLLIQLCDICTHLESVRFIFGFDFLVPSLRNQFSLTNAVLQDYSSHLNTELRLFQEQIDSEVLAINKVLYAVVAEQTRILHEIMSNLCRLTNNTELTLINCNKTILMNTMAHSPMVHSCNFLPIFMLRYVSLGSNGKEFLDGDLEEFLLPSVIELRRLIFSTVYILIAILCLGLVSHIITHAAFKTLVNKGQVPFKMIYQASRKYSACFRTANVDWQCNENNQLRNLPNHPAPPLTLQVESNL